MVNTFKPPFSEQINKLFNHETTLGDEYAQIFHLDNGRTGPAMVVIIPDDKDNMDSYRVIILEIIRLIKAGYGTHIKDMLKMMENINSKENFYWPGFPTMLKRIESTSLEENFYPTELPNKSDFLRTTMAYENLDHMVLGLISNVGHTTTYSVNPDTYRFVVGSCEVGSWSANLSCTDLSAWATLDSEMLLLAAPESENQAKLKVARQMSGPYKPNSASTTSKIQKDLVERANTAATLYDTNAADKNYRDRIMERYPCLNSREVAEFSHSKSNNKYSIASDWLRRGKIFSVHSLGKNCYPAFQFQHGRPKPIIAKILIHLKKSKTPWAIFAFFVEPDHWSCRGKSPVDILDIEPEAVIEAARHAVVEVID
jgi:hypothetical protein